MKNLFKEKFALTEQGANDLVKASVVTFLNYAMNMFPAILLMLIFEQLVLGNVKSKLFYIGISVFILVAMYILLNIEYNSLYNATYRESENLRIDIARTLSKLPLSYFSKHDLSDLAQTIMGDVAAIEHALSHAIAKTLGFIVFFIVVSVMLLVGNVKLGLAVILPILLTFVLILLSKKMQIKSQGKYYKKLRENAESFQETIELQQEIKSFAMSEKIKKKLYKEMEESEKIHIKSEISTGLVMNISGIVLYVSLVSVIILGTTMLINQEINILYFIGYLLAAIKLKEGADAISFNLAELFYIDSMIERIKEIKNTKLQEGEDIELNNFDIEFKNVSFYYNKDTKVLNDISFVAKQNEVTALVGKSGCGKTSILRLISRLYDCNEGKIEISGKDIKEISTKSLFDKVSIVFQDVTLFNTSIMENIRIGNLTATDDDVKLAAKLANCEFIDNLKDGYNTIIGENGATLSGGERQRISIARAFLKNAPIIILDEIAASLDVDNEKKIQESLNKLTKDKTVIIISHRLKSIENVDKIVVIEDKKVEAIGKHKDLLEKSKTYKSLVKKAKLAEEFKY
ncbi:MAG: ABC transporter ATP-binding protein [Peptoniphilaceae bacterium]|uniref:ABC transporter ATP-binding protein n=1 Tax=Parvimonas sp. TaxID=1944660 RepID=UPI0025E08FD7|nr:ABC transporter ATP-binding protein [Parvimonas sp.]MCI5997217.1 ABC transporter ATP-binding protein/permease [Parvimonas sp.]MDD7764482.1 ABC transporter ATP-binding protein [Peptoniphilaceae bacterium]MDY3051292.1 ABC transporter ATP-binding protein [Parvimonas sp.]